MKEEYYRICLRHMGKNDNCFLFWGPNNSGYYRSIEDIGIYDSTHTSNDDPLVLKSIVEKYKQEIKLPKYGERQETYMDKGSFFVLPNTGQVRKALGITTLDIQLEGDRNSFNAYFLDTEIEVFKEVKSKTWFHVQAKQHVPEFWYLDGIFEAETRNKAISDAFNEWMPCDYDNYIEFKKDVTCKRKTTIVLDKWRKL